eukprot:3615325-Amphidinium_carterae.2
MKTTWNNTTQQPSVFIRLFQNWHDEIYNYENATQAEISQSMEWHYYYKHPRRHKVSPTTQREHATPDFDKTATKVEDTTGKPTSTTTTQQEYT